MEVNVKKIAWRTAATGGLYLGLVLTAIMVMGYLFKISTDYNWITGLLNAIALIAFIYYYTKNISSHYSADLGFSYPQSMAFILKLMLFAGILAGLGQWILQNFVDPQYYLDQVELNLLNSGIDDDQAEMIVSSSASALKNPILMVLSGAFGMIVYGGLIGLVVSAFVRKRANPFAEENDTKQA